MKQYVLRTFLIFMLPSFAAGQDVEDSFTREKLKGYNIILIKAFNNASDSSVYTVDARGDIIKKEYYSDGKLERWWQGEYDEYGNLTYFEAHSQIYKYNEAAGDHLPEWDETYYSGIIYEYNGKRLESTTHFDVIENENSFNQEVRFIYDKLGRLVEEIQTNNFNGYTGNFKSNSTELDTLYLKDKVETKQVVYNYKGDTVIAKNVTGGDVTGYTFKILNDAGNPARILVADENKETLLEHTFSYSKEGNLIEENRRILNLEKLTMDFAAGDLVKTRYNERGLPIESKTYDEGKFLYGYIFEYK